MLAGLDIGVEISEESVDKILARSKRRGSEAKTVELNWEIDGVDPPDDPIMFARAHRIRIGDEDSD